MISSTHSHLIDYVRLMMEHTPVGIALYDVSDFRLLEANASFRKYVDAYLPEQLGINLSQPVSSLPSIPWIQEIVRIFQQVSSSGIPFHTSAHRVQLSEAHTTYWKWSLQPLTDETGTVRFLLQTMSNVTNEIETQRVFKESQEFYKRSPLPSIEQGLLRTLLDQFSEGILIVDITSGSTSYANGTAARLLGLSLSQLLNTPLHNHLWPHNETRTTSTAAMQPQNTPWLFPVVHALCGEMVKAQETLISRPDGSTLTVLTSSIPLSTEQGVIVGAVVVFQDIPSHKSLELHKQNFISTVSHELRTPITTIQGLAELLQISISRGHSINATHVRRIFDRLSEQSQHLAHLVSELLDVSLLEQGQFTLNRERCDLLPLIVRGVEYFTAANAAYRHAIHLSLEGPITTDMLIGNFDKDRVERMIRNLVGNAIKYSPAGSAIEVTLHHTLDHPYEAMLTVRDEGFGIPTYELPHIFERWKRSEQLDPSISGLGIGLYLARETITRHGGCISVESVEGQGSTFYVTLPLAQEQE